MTNCLCAQPRAIFGVYFPRCVATREINTEITFSGRINSSSLQLIHYYICVSPVTLLTWRGFISKLTESPKIKQKMYVIGKVAIPYWYKRYLPKHNDKSSWHSPVRIWRSNTCISDFNNSCFSITYYTFLACMNLKCSKTNFSINAYKIKPYEGFCFHFGKCKFGKRWRFKIVVYLTATKSCRCLDTTQCFRRFPSTG